MSMNTNQSEFNLHFFLKLLTNPETHYYKIMFNSNRLSDNKITVSYLTDLKTDLK